MSFSTHKITPDAGAKNALSFAPIIKRGIDATRNLNMMAARFVLPAKWRVKKLVGNALKMSRSDVFYTHISQCRPMIGKVASTTGGRDGVNRAKNEVEVMVLSELAAICMKRAENSAVPVRLREQADELVQEFEWLVSNRDKSDAAMHLRGEHLLARMARFWPD